MSLNKPESWVEIKEEMGRGFSRIWADEHGLVKLTFGE